MPIKGVTVSDQDMHETCPDEVQCVRMDISVRAFKGTLKLNTRSNLNLYFDGRSGSGFSARIADLNSAIKVLFYAVESTDLLGTEASTVKYYNTQQGSNQEFVTVVASDQGFTGQAGTAQVTSIRIDLVIVAVNDGPTVKSTLMEFNAENTDPTEDILGSLAGISIEDPDLQENIESTLASRNWMGKASNSPYLNQMRLQLSVTFGVLKLGYTRNLLLVFTQTTMYLTLSPLKFGHDMCRVSKLIDDSSILSSEYGRVVGGQADIADGEEVSFVVSEYQGICAYDNVGGSTCPTGTEPGCKCFKDGACDSVNGKIVLHLNRSRAILPFVKALTSLLDARDQTCGGLPVYPAPNNFTVGMKCSNDKVCVEMPKCIPGVTCACCANVSFICNDNSDCSVFDSGSLCGCVKGGNGRCGPYFLQSDPGGEPVTDLISPGVGKPEYGGVPCTYTGVGSGTCKSAAYAAEGSNLAKIVDLIALSSLGTNDAALYGPLVDINRALDSLSYLTVPDYNRFYRPPPELQDVTFKPEADSLDTLVVTANDFGNSGGGPRDQRSNTLETPIRVAAVNDRPTAEGPARVLAFEDLPFHFQDGDAHPLRGPHLSISDPDYLDYLFGVEIFSVNISCLHGRLFLNEDFLRSERTDRSNPNRPVQYEVGMAQEDQPLGRSGIIFKIWDENQELRGVSNVEYDFQGIQTRGTEYIKYGKGCQFKPQCSDGANLNSDDTSFGFFETQWYGKVYPLEGQTVGRDAHSCGICSDVVGNRFISLEGTFEDINKALELVTYLPDPHFNTRYGIKEYITFSVNDNGALGNDRASSPSLSHTHQIEVIVDSVNDRPIVGRRVRMKRPYKFYDGGKTPDVEVDDYAVLPINQTLDARCMRFPPAGTDYKETCNAGVREYIDVDEDTLFYITPSNMWIHDVDAGEAELMPVLRRYCCQEAGEEACICGRRCNCGAGLCKCDVPDVCEGGAGELLVSFQVDNGLLSLYPPPGRSVFPQEQLVFLTNLTDIDMMEGGMMIPCPDQRSCMQNMTRLQFRTTISVLQKALEQMFLTYVPRPNYFGRDAVQIYVNDKGFTDDCYNSSLGVRIELNIRVVAVNDPPVISATDQVLLYGRGEKCLFDYQKYYTSRPVGLSEGCALMPNSTRVPQPEVGSSWSFADVDMDATPYGNLTILLIVGQMVPDHAYAGTFLFKETLKFSTIWYSEYRNLDGLMQLEVAGRMEEINYLMDYLAYNADDTFQGYAPFKVMALDEQNYGECSGAHRCGSGSSVCMDPTEAEHHDTPRMGITSKLVDVTIGAPKTCISSVALYGSVEAACTKCRGSTKVNGIGCGWCPTSCPELGGKCMIADDSGPRFETCPEVEGVYGWNQCEPAVSNLPVIAGGLAGFFVISVVLCYVFTRWAQRRHGSVLTYARRKRYDFIAVLRRVNLMPPDHANYFQLIILVIFAISLRLGLSMAGDISSYEPLCDFQQEYFVDKSSSLEMMLDNCKVDFVPVPEQESPDDTLLAVKMRMAIAKHEDILVESSTCGLKATFSIANNKPESIRYLNYFCNIQFFIPLNGFVLPGIKIVAQGDNVTTVNSGPTQATPEFGLAFGPNDFVLEGVRMIAKLHRVSAKNFRYIVDHGQLILIDLRVLVSAEFESLTSDMTVTSPLRSSVDFWQKEANKVCLTAAKGSLYVDDSCEQICRMRDKEGNLIVETAAEDSEGSRRRRTWTGGDRPQSDVSAHKDPHDRRHEDRGFGFEDVLLQYEALEEGPIERLSGNANKSLSAWANGRQRAPTTFRPEKIPGKDSVASTRVLGANTTTLHGLTITDPVGGAQGQCNGTTCKPFVCTGNPNIDAEWTCFPYDAIQEALKEPCPPGASYAFRKDVPQVPGCTNLQFCMLDGKFMFRLWA